MKLNKRQLLATHLLATGLSAKETALQIGIRQETISRWKNRYFCRPTQCFTYRNPRNNTHETNRDDPVSTRYPIHSS